VERLYYAVVVGQYVGFTSGYYDLYFALRQAAAQAGWTSAQLGNLYRACKAVEIASGEKDVYVDGSSQCGIPNGDESCGGLSGGPFRKVQEGLSSAWPGDRLLIRAGSYPEKVSFDKILEVRALGGSVSIGQIP